MNKNNNKNIEDSGESSFKGGRSYVSPPQLIVTAGKV